MIKITMNEVLSASRQSFVRFVSCKKVSNILEREGDDQQYYLPRIIVVLTPKKYLEKNVVLL